MLAILILSIKTNSLITPKGNEDDVILAFHRRKHGEAKEFDSHEPPSVVVRMRFINHADFRKLIKHYVISNRIAITCQNNDRRHITSHYVNRIKDSKTHQWTRCEWNIHASLNKE